MRLAPCMRQRGEAQRLRIRHRRVELEIHGDRVLVEPSARRRSSDAAERPRGARRTLDEIAEAARRPASIPSRRSAEADPRGARRRRTPSLRISLDRVEQATAVHPRPEERELEPAPERWGAGREEPAQHGLVLIVRLRRAIRLVEGAIDLRPVVDEEAGDRRSRAERLWRRSSCFNERAASVSPWAGEDARDLGCPSARSCQVDDDGAACGDRPRSAASQECAAA